MIASLTGKILSSSNGQVVIDVQGVGYLVNTTSQASKSLEIGNTSTLFTNLVVREDSMTLFGFLQSSELEIFELLLSVNGVGPKSALAILSQLSVDQISAAVFSENDATFKSVSGIGAKTAKLIVLTLSGKLGTKDQIIQSGAHSEKAVAGLIGLGWSEKQSREAVGLVNQTDLSEKQVLKAALQILSKVRKS